MFYLVLLLFVSFAAEATFGGPGAREFGGHCSTSKKFRPYQETQTGLIRRPYLTLQMKLQTKYIYI